MRSTPDILIIDTKPIDRGLERNLITTEGFDVDCVVIDSTKDLVNAGEGVPAFIIAADVQFSREVFESLSTLQVVGRAGIGVDNIDLEAAADTGTKVLNVPDYCIDEVSTHALSLMLACLRGVPMYGSEVRSGEWDWEAGRPIHRLSEQTIGLVGLGKIGRSFARKVMTLDATVIAYDPYVDDDVFAVEGVRRVGFEDMLDQATLASIHCPLTPETRNCFGSDEFDRMNSNGVLINTARGPIVDQDALVEALRTGKIRAAGLDVFEDEPLGNFPLQNLSNVLLTPHVAWYSEAAQKEVKHTITEDVMGVLAGDSPQNPVDLDQPW